MIYFENVLDYGDLELEKILFMFDQTPIVFVCKDLHGNRYLCQCTDMIVGYSWMITQISPKILIEMIRDNISILSAFKESAHPIVMADQVKNGIIDYQKVNFTDIAEEDLPDSEEKLENPNLNDYVKQLQEQDSLYHTILKIDVEEPLKNFSFIECNQHWKQKKGNMGINYTIQFSDENTAAIKMKDGYKKGIYLSKKKKHNSLIFGNEIGIDSKNVIAYRDDNNERTYPMLKCMV